MFKNKFLLGNNKKKSEKEKWKRAKKIEVKIRKTRAEITYFLSCHKSFYYLLSTLCVCVLAVAVPVPNCASKSSNV